MAYRPKSKYKIQTAGAGEFMEKTTSKPYVGKYIELSDGTYQAGDTKREGPVLVLVNPKKKDNTYRVNNRGIYLDHKTRKNAFNYSKLKKEIQHKQDKFEPIYSSKSPPTVKEYKKGQFRRYFCRRKNTLNEYKEITKKVFKSINKEEGKYDHNLYEVGAIQWVLTDDNLNANSRIVKIINRAFPNVGSILFSNLSEYHLPDSLFKPKTQLEEIESGDDTFNEETGEIEPPLKTIPISGVDPRLEEVKKEIEAEVQNIVSKKVKHTPKTASRGRRKKSKGLKNSLRNLKKFKRRKSSGGGGGSSSGGGGGGY